MSRNAEDILDLKPNFYGVGFNFNALWRSLRKKPNPLMTVPIRFLELFEAHNVAVSQIPRLVPGLSLDQLSSPESLLPVLTPEHLRIATNLFQVRQAWLEGASNIIYDIHPSYKNPWAFFENLKTLDAEQFGFPVVGFTSVMQFDWQSQKNQPILLVMREKCAQLDDKTVYRYRIHDQFLWGYWKSRIQLKAMMRILYLQSKTPVRVYRVNGRVLSEMEEGRMIPGPYYKQSQRIKNIELEDFSLMPSESRQAKDLDEFPTVLDYIDAYKLDCIGENGVSNPTNSNEAMQFC